MDAKIYSSLSASTMKIIVAALDADPAATPALRRQILEACSSAPESPRTAPEGERLYTPSEAAQIAGVSLVGLLKWIHAGKLEAQRSGKRSFLISATALDPFVAGRTPRPVAAADLPDRLAHLAPGLNAKPRRKGR